MSLVSPSQLLPLGDDLRVSKECVFSKTCENRVSSVEMHV